MTIALYGLNHKSAPLSLRETLAVPTTLLPQALELVMDSLDIDEAAILSTCNRTELCCHFTDDMTPEARHKQLNIWLAKVRRLDAAELGTRTYYYEDIEAVSHMMRVAAGMDSMVLGEPEIMGQVKKAWRIATAEGVVGAQLNPLSQHVLRTAKQIRTSTGISEGPVSLAFAVLKLARRIFDDLSKRQILCVGGGEIIQLIVRHLAAASPKRLVIANRTLHHVQPLAQEFGSSAVSLDELGASLKHSDIVIAATGSPVALIDKNMTEAALAHRKRQPMLMIDLAVPRNIDPAIGTLDDVYLHRLDDLQDIIKENSQQRHAARAEGEGMVASAASGFMAHLKAQAANHLIQQLRDTAEASAAEAVTKAKAQLAAGADPEAVLERLAGRLTSQWLHKPTTRIKQAMSEGDAALIEAAGKLHQLSSAQVPPDQDCHQK